MEVIAVVEVMAVVEVKERVVAVVERVEVATEMREVQRSEAAKAG